MSVVGISGVELESRRFRVGVNSYLVVTGSPLRYAVLNSSASWT
jgi:hypothetical protein